jgi:hypothetical protein
MIMDMAVAAELSKAGFKKDAAWLGVCAGFGGLYLLMLKMRVIQQRRLKEKGNLDTSTLGGADW